MVEGNADLAFEERALFGAILDIEYQPVDLSTGVGQRLYAPNRADAIKQWRRHFGDDVGLAGLQHAQPHGVLGHRAQHQRAHLGYPAPVLFVGLHLDPLVDRAGNEAERTGPDRPPREALLTYLLQVGARDDPTGEGQLLQEDRVFLLEGQGDAVRIEDLDLVDRLDKVE